MNVTLYTFSKKHNSTAVPTTGGTSVDVVLKDEAGVLDPIIELHTSASPSAYNYLYIPTFGRYYWLREWTYNRGIWTGSFYVDSLASWKAGIGAQNLYVFRSAAEWDGHIVDNFYPRKATTRYVRYAITPIFNTDPAQQAGFYVVGFIVGNDVKYIACTGAALNDMLTGLFSPQYFESVSGAVTLTPEIKTAINPMQYITKIHHIPASIGVGWSNTWARFGSAMTNTVSSLTVGKGTIDFSLLTPARSFTYWDFGNRYVTDMYLPISVGTAQFKHPQQDDRGYFVRSAPFTTWSLWLPPFGLIELPSDSMLYTSDITLRVTADVRTGAARLVVYGTNISSVSDTIMVSSVGNVAVDHPISGTFVPGSNFMSIAGSVLGGVLSAASGNIGGVFNNMQNAINTYAVGTVPHTSTIGSQGSGSELNGTPELVAQFIPLVDDDLTGRGRPLCSKRLISSIPGYITADPDELSLAASARELEEIRGFISGGFFYE